MQYRRFGRTELAMPVFSCGGMRYQYKWKDVPAWEIPGDNQRNLEATINRSLEVGINHIETARGYGTSEMQLGKILPKFPREKLIIQTKVSPKEDPKEFRRQFNQSLKFLQLDYVDLLGLHGINTEEILDYCIRPGGCLEEARKLQKQGKIRFIGFSTHGATDIIKKTIKTDSFDYVNLHWYYINQVNWSAIEAAKKHDMGVFIISPSDKGGKLYDPPKKLVELCQPLSPMVFNDLFCLSHPEVHTLSLGAARPRDFDEHLKTLSLLDDPQPILKPILARLEEEAIKILGEDWVKSWDKGLPNYQETPGNINIETILWLRNLALAYNMIEYGKMRYNLLGSGGHWFPGKNAENVQKLDLSNCLSHSPHRDKIPDCLAEAHRLLGGQSIQRLSQS
ncbi:unknown [Crocosphaera subtropica ATCC 51142]|uniref:NADP-dependent oxidoreductase domain-containing protein n=1 Tax=Crocosphaera subtropica (strain ATCC 51142 / BH68) TaxID=43989 RepID=B1X1L4_CROS5|nr:aldo/keto reductase [Crocosphaera subtropica]ACB53044.1 unknown [Crocosphaera subtropica ATCC 51142]